MFDLVHGTPEEQSAAAGKLAASAATFFATRRATGGGATGTGGLRPPGHGASFRIMRPDGSTRRVGNATSGRMTNGEKATRSRSISDTEQRILRTNPLEPGETLVIDGFKPPCRTCQGKMRKATADTPDTTIHYTYYDDAGNLVVYTYRGGVRVNP